MQVHNSAGNVVVRHFITVVHQNKEQIKPRHDWSTEVQVLLEHIKRHDGSTEAQVLLETH